jgi:hypothetical protein
MHPIESPPARRRALAARLLYVIDTPAARLLAARLTPQPLRAPAPGTPEYAADWQSRFDRAYQLEPGRSIRYIAPPFPPEREAFFQATVQHYLRANPGAVALAPLAPGEAMAITVSDRVGAESPIMRLSPSLHIGNHPLPAKGLTRALVAVHALGSPLSDKYPPVVVAPSMEDLDLPGDWVSSKSAPQEQLLQDLSRIILEQTGRHITFKPGTVKQESLVVRGHYAYHAQNPTDPPNTIEVYSDVKDDVPDPQMLVHQRLKELFVSIGSQLNLPVIDETDSGQRQAKWMFHGSYMFLKPENADLLLKNVADQTSLTFTRESRDRPMMTAEESPQPSPPLPATRP